MLSPRLRNLVDVEAVYPHGLALVSSDWWGTGRPGGSPDASSVSAMREAGGGGAY